MEIFVVVVVMMMATMNGFRCGPVHGSGQDSNKVDAMVRATAEG